MAKTLAGIGCFAAGAGVGALIALLYAPRAGKHTRARLRSSADRTFHRIDEIRDDVRGYMSELVDDVSETVMSGIGNCRKAVDAGGSRVQQTLDKVRSEIGRKLERAESLVKFPERT
ncbi:MAG TPA: YtxH domain-containing protein [Terriglobia bacterium]|nr:YtxH domain-containing protein [Terriglobia bacterium]